jgi:hypothetical protein
MSLAERHAAKPPAKQMRSVGHIAVWSGRVSDLVSDAGRVVGAIRQRVFDSWGNGPHELPSSQKSVGRIVAVIDFATVTNKLVLLDID